MKGAPQDLGLGPGQLIPQEGEPVDEPKDSLEAMATAAEEEVDEPLDEPATPCHKPWFELTALGPGEEPLKNAAYKIDLPSVQQEGELDGQGFLRLEDVRIEPGSYIVKVISEEGESGSVTYRVEVVPPEALETVEREESFDPQLDAIRFTNAP